MSRPFPARALTAVLLSLAVLLGGAASASASDATLKAKVVSLDKRYEKKAAKIEYPEGVKSPTFGQDYTAASAKFQALLKTYRTGISKEQASSDRGRRARKLLLSSLAEIRAGLKALAPLIVKSAQTAAAGGQDAPADLEAAKKIGKDLQSAIKDNARAYKLLGLKVSKTDPTGSAKA